MQKSVNRSLDDPRLDDVDHALGRPRNPLKASYRNHYAAGSNSDECEFMKSSDWWQEWASRSDHQLTTFVVTQAGRKALADYLNK